MYDILRRQLTVYMTFCHVVVCHSLVLCHVPKLPKEKYLSQNIVWHAEKYSFCIAKSRVSNY